MGRKMRKCQYTWNGKKRWHILKRYDMMKEDEKIELKLMKMKREITRIKDKEVK